MVEKNLKAGDTFIDGGLPYIVLKVLPNGNYVSRIKNADDEKEAVEKAEKEAEKPKRTTKKK